MGQTHIDTFSKVRERVHSWDELADIWDFVLLNAKARLVLTQKACVFAEREELDP